MTTSYKVLGQAAPAAAVLSDLYVAPPATQAISSSIVISNRAAASAFRVAVRPAGAPIENKHYICYDSAIGAADTIILTLGMTLAPTDVVSVYARDATLAFNLFGSEVN